MQQCKSEVRLTVSPTPSLFDQRLKVVATGLSPGMKYTIVAQPVSKGEVLSYQSYAHYIADIRGELDLDNTPSCGGSYKGIEPMGLVHGMKSMFDGDVKSITDYGKIENPEMSVSIKFELYANHIEPFSTNQEVNTSTCTLLAHATAERRVRSADVQRIEVREGRLRGTLFIPKRDVPLPAVIEIGGFYPRILQERRPSMIASYGYVTLALAYAEYDNLPSRDHLEVEYFLEAIDWLLSLPEVDKNKVVIISSSYGSGIALHLAEYTNKIKAIVAINTSSYLMKGALRYGGQLISRPLTVNHREKVYDGNIYVFTIPIVHEYTIAIEKAAEHTKFLFICGEMDTVTPPEHTRLLVNRLERAGRSDNVKVTIYPGMGHLVKPPYVPVMSKILVPGTDGNPKWINAGDETPDAPKSTESAWHEIIAFIANVCANLKF